MQKSSHRERGREKSWYWTLFSLFFGPSFIGGKRGVAKLQCRQRKLSLVLISITKTVVLCVK